MVTIERLREVLDYNPNTGVFRWKTKVNLGVKPGAKAGWYNRGYVLIAFDNCKYRAHRLAWFYVHGKWPEKDLDHINRIKDDNRITNLREATTAQNNRNFGLTKRNQSGSKGVYFRKDRGTWRARVKLNRKYHCAGCYKTKEEAVAAYNVLAKQLHGEFMAKSKC